MSTPILTPPTQHPNPIQNFQWTAEDFKNPGRINTQMQQLILAVQALQGTAGKTVLPSGVDVQGATVSGLGKPSHPSDAISAAHADSNYSPGVVAPQLDLGGKNALKGLTLLWQKLSKGTGVSGIVTLAKITPGGSNGSLTFVDGIITGFVQPS